MKFFQLIVAFLAIHGHHKITTGKKGLASAVRSRRYIAVPEHLNITIEISTHPAGECDGGNAGLGDTALRLEFRSNASNFQWVEAASGIPIDGGLYSTTVRADCECVEFRLVQEEHGGGDCNCWSVGSVEVNGVAVDLQVNNIEEPCSPCGK